MTSIREWWAELRHGGLFISESRLAQHFEKPATELVFWREDRLRRAVTGLNRAKTETVAVLADTLLEQVCGLNGDAGFSWLKGANVETARWSIKAATGETLRPARTAQGPHGAFLPLFIDAGIARIGVHTGRRTVARVHEWLRAVGQPMALLTNGTQWRLIYAGPDHDAWIEWDTDLFFVEGRVGPQVHALRTLISPDSLTPAAEKAPSKLLVAVQDSRKGQSELSAELGENVRKAVEDLIRAHGSQLAELDATVTPNHIYLAATRIVMRMVVVLFAEARDLLPRENPIYHAAYGLQGLREQLEKVAHTAGGERLRHRRTSWPRVLALFRLVYLGSHHERLIVPRYSGQLFKPGKGDSTDPLERALSVIEDPANAPTDEVLFGILQKLCRSRVKVRQGRSSTWVATQVDFSDLSSEYIGILYEGLLDYELRRVDHDPIVFLKLGDEPALPLSRLEKMDDKAIGNLVEKMKVKKAAATEGDEDAEEDADEAEQTPEEEPEEEPEEDAPEVEAPPDEIAPPLEDSRLAARSRAETWARKAVTAAKIIKKPRGKQTADKERQFEEAVAKAAENLVTRVILPGEWFLVRWGGTRKGSGTFYTRPQLAVPTTQRTLRPLAYTAPDGNADAPPVEWRAKPPVDILGLKVCDPAMGSGSFPLAALRFLTDALFESLFAHGWLLAQTDGSVRWGNPSPPIPEWFVKTLADMPGINEPPPRHHGGDDRTVEELLRARLKRVIVEHCIYGVDFNPMAVELGRLALWIETMDRNLPFDFFDHKLKCGNALVGCWFDQFRDYPIMAWTREAGDKTHNGVQFAKGTGEKAIKEKYKQVKKSLETWLRDVVGDKPKELFGFGTNPEKLVEAAREKLAAIHAIPLHEPDRKAVAYRELQSDPAYQMLRQAFDVWCAVWFWPTDKLPDAITPLHFFGPGGSQRAIAEDLRLQHRFFHWELEFPDVFTARTQSGPPNSAAGFSAILGNPPWETLQPSSKEYFSNIDPLYRSYSKQDALAKQKEYFGVKPDQESDWLAYLAHFKALTHYTKWAADPWGYNLLKNGKPGYSFGTSIAAKRLADAWEKRRAKHQGFADPAHPYRLQRPAVEVDDEEKTGDKKSKRSASKAYTYRLFLESALATLGPGGRLGFVVPSGLYSDEGSTTLRRHALDHCQWEWLFGFENRDGIFDIHRSFKFCPIIVQKGGRTEAIKAAFMRRDLNDWEQPQPEHLPYTREQVTRFSPSTFAILELRSRRDLEILKKIYGSSVLLGDTTEGGWGIKYQQGDFNMTSDSALFPRRSVWEAKGYKPDEYGRWLLGPWRDRAGSQEAPPEAPRHTLPAGLLVSQEGTQYLHESEIQDDDYPQTTTRNGRKVVETKRGRGIALPLMQGGMLGHYDSIAAEYAGGTGHSVQWAPVSWHSKYLGPQYLVGIAEVAAAGIQPATLRMGYRYVANPTNKRTMLNCALLPNPCGHTIGVLHTDRDAVFTVTAATNSFLFDSVLRTRFGGSGGVGALDPSKLIDLPLPPRNRGARWLKTMALRLNCSSRHFAPSWLLAGAKIDVSWRQQWACKSSERLRIQVASDAIVAGLAGIEVADLAFILVDCDHPLSLSKNKAFTRKLDQKGFWRVDKDKDPELRHTVLTLVAFHDLQQHVRSHGGDLDKGIESFCNQNNGQGWMLPETVRLADYNLGHDERAKQHQPVAERLGPRFYDWQLTQSPEESWQECHLHARNILGEQGYQQLLNEIATEGQATTPRANASSSPGSSASAKNERAPTQTEPTGQKTTFPKPQKDMFGK